MPSVEEDGSRGGGGRPCDRDRIGGSALPPWRRLGAQILELLQGKAANQAQGFRLLLQTPFASFSPEGSLSRFADFHAGASVGGSLS